MNYTTDLRKTILEEGSVGWRWGRQEITRERSRDQVGENYCEPERSPDLPFWDGSACCLALISTKYLFRRNWLSAVKKAIDSLMRGCEKVSLYCMMLYMRKHMECNWKCMQ